jgi:hypothetical protein
MNEVEIRERKAAIEAQFGPWTAANIPSDTVSKQTRNAPVHTYFSAGSCKP